MILCIVVMTSIVTTMTTATEVVTTISLFPRKHRMSGLKIAVIVGIVIFILPVTSAAQQKTAKFGPVVGAYLTGLTEELHELEYQIKRDEISRSDYERAKQRLNLLRRLVERLATKNRVDLVPEFQILADDELKTLGLSSELDPNLLTVGAEFENQWRLLGIESGGKVNRARLFIFERLRQKEVASRGEPAPERKRNKELDLAAIETIVINERPPENAAPQPASVAPTASNTDPQDRIQLPRILQVYPPEYTGKARDQRIEGDLIVRALFQRDGKIKDIKIEKGLGFGLDQRAIEAVKRIGFLPAQIDGQDADAQVEIAFSFTLEIVSVSVNATNAGVMEKGAKQ